MSKFSNWTKNTKGFFEALIQRDYPTPNDRPYVKSVTYEVKRYQQDQITLVDIIKNGVWYSPSTGETFHAPILVEEIPAVTNNGDMYIRTVFTVEYTWYYAGGSHIATYVPTTLDADEYALNKFLEEHPEWLYYTKGTENNPYKLGDDLKIYHPNDPNGGWDTDIKAFLQDYVFNYYPDKPLNAASVLIPFQIVLRSTIHSTPIFHLGGEVIVNDLILYDGFEDTYPNPPSPIYINLQDNYAPNYINYNKKYFIRTHISFGFEWLDSANNSLAGGFFNKEILSKDEVYYAIYNNNSLSSIWDITYEQEEDTWTNGIEILRLQGISASYPILSHTNILTYFENLIKNDFGDGIRQPIIFFATLYHYIYDSDKETKNQLMSISLYDWVYNYVPREDDYGEATIPYLWGHWFLANGINEVAYLQVYMNIQFRWADTPSSNYDASYLVRTPSGQRFLKINEGP